MTSQHELIYNKLIESVGKEKAQQYADAKQKVLNGIGSNPKYGIDCDWQERASYLYAMREGKSLRDEYKAAVELNLPAALTDENRAAVQGNGSSAITGEEQASFIEILAENGGKNNSV